MQMVAAVTASANTNLGAVKCSFIIVYLVLSNVIRTNSYQIYDWPRSMLQLIIIIRKI